MGQYRAPSKQALAAALMETGGAVFFEGIDNSIPRDTPPPNFWATIIQVEQTAPVLWQAKGRSHDGLDFTAVIQYQRPPGGSLGDEDTARVTWADGRPGYTPSEVGARAG